MSVKGVGDLLVRFTKCCHPIPGDPIVGFITRGKGVTVHLSELLDRAQRARGVAADRRRVGGRVGQTYPIAIRVEAYDRTGLLNDITQVVAENKVNIVAAAVSVNPDPHGGRRGHAAGLVGRAAGAGRSSRIEQLQGRPLSRPARLSWGPACVPQPAAQEPTQRMDRISGGGKLRPDA